MTMLDNTPEPIADTIAGPGEFPALFGQLGLLANIDQPRLAQAALIDAMREQAEALLAQAEREERELVDALAADGQWSPEDLGTALGMPDLLDD